MSVMVYCCINYLWKNIFCSGGLFNFFPWQVILCRKFLRLGLERLLGSQILSFGQVFYCNLLAHNWKCLCIRYIVQVLKWCFVRGCWAWVSQTKNVTFSVRQWVKYPMHFCSKCQMWMWWHWHFKMTAIVKNGECPLSVLSLDSL